jgi:hypothetical protein
VDGSGQSSSGWTDSIQCMKQYSEYEHIQPLPDALEVGRLSHCSRILLVAQMFLQENSQIDCLLLLIVILVSWLAGVQMSCLASSVGRSSQQAREDDDDDDSDGEAAGEVDHGVHIL